MAAMVEGHMPLVGIGLYSVGDTALLTRAPERTIRRWIRGDVYRRRGALRESRPVWQAEIGLVDDALTLSFLDMMEVRFIRAFRAHRVSWAAIRAAATLAREMFGDGHPFTRRRFRTDGKRIFSQIEDAGSVRLFDLNRKSWVFHEIVEPSLYQGVEFQDDQVARWYPMFPEKTVLVDPRIAFGRPVALPARVPTDLLAAAARSEGSAAMAAAWYKVPVSTVEAAVTFEDRLCAVGAKVRTAA
jgi:uncharacterized protein (DUF433 family)